MSCCIVQCTVVHIYVCFVNTELLYRQSRVPKSQVQLVNRAIYLCNNRDRINQGHVFFSFFTSSLAPSPMASSQKFQLDLRFSSGKILSANLYSSSIYSTYSWQTAPYISAKIATVSMKGMFSFSFFTSS